MKRKLTETEWASVFDLRCKSKRGVTLSREEHALCVAAFKEDRARYASMTQGVFVVTAPFGSDVEET